MMHSIPESHEVNFDGLVGPTHTYAGLSFGNVASVSHRSLTSNPREAALQGLRKMKVLAELGFKQAVLPPQQRPDLITLRSLGFYGNDSEVLEKAWKTQPELLFASYSASSMWTANAATVAPCSDTQDGRTHFTPANLLNKFHRSLETETTSRILRAIFSDEAYFAHHSPLPPGGTLFSDEGAANHTRLTSQYGSSGIHFFVFGRSTQFSKTDREPKLFPARQTLEASQAIARLHLLNPDSVVFGQQNPDAIDAGAFHNDVVAVGNLNVLFFHEKAFEQSDRLISELDTKLQVHCGTSLIPIQVFEQEVSLENAVKSYLFNSQLLHLPEGGMLLIAPEECKEVLPVAQYLNHLIQSGSTPIRAIRYFDLRQSMRNGGGPACLRLRVVLNDDEIAHCAPHVFMNDALYTHLCNWATHHYRDQLTPDDLRDPSLITESQSALDELTQILGLGSIYPFQRST